LISVSSLNEMKKLSLVCKDLFLKVRLSKYFKEDATLVIGNNHDFGLRNLSMGDLLPNSKKPEIANYPWKGLKFDLTTDFLLREYNFLIMNSLEYLAFVRWLRLMTIGPNIPNVMKELLKSSPNLKHLELDFSIFLKQNAPLRKFFTNSKVRGNLKNLERLDIVEIEFAQNKFPGEYADEILIRLPPVFKYAVVFVFLKYLHAKLVNAVNWKLIIEADQCAPPLACYYRYLCFETF